MIGKRLELITTDFFEHDGFAGKARGQARSQIIVRSVHAQGTGYDHRLCVDDFRLQMKPTLSVMTQ